MAVDNTYEQQVKISVLTLVKGRHQALHHLIEGLRSGNQFPDELIIVHMNELPCAVPKTAFPIVQVAFNSAHSLPLAAARNFAVDKASQEHLVFLDVDCIPANDMLQTYRLAFQQQDCLWSGRIRYLGPAAMSEPDVLNKLQELSAPDPVRGHLDQFTYEQFWSLNFGCSKETFQRIGGFDESYTGYGAEDTDFAFQARKNQVEFRTLPALAYHQHHASYDPPLNHLKDIIANATTFHKKWRVWPMGGWLDKFERMGFISRANDDIKVLRMPSAKEIAECLKQY